MLRAGPPVQEDQEGQGGQEAREGLEAQRVPYPLEWPVPEGRAGQAAREARRAAAWA